MKRLLLACAILSIGVAIASPRHGPHPGHRPPAPHVYHHPHHYHHGSYFGSFWSGFTGAVIGNAIYEAIKPAPAVVAAPAPQPAVVIQSPTVVPKQIWVEGHYENQVLANGSVVSVWIPGRWVEVR